VAQARGVIALGRSSSRRSKRVNSEQLNFDNEPEVERLAAGVRELHPKRDSS
jgi:hypothetical protein